jgi:hypothetical protein
MTTRRRLAAALLLSGLVWLAGPELALAQATPEPAPVPARQHIFYGQTPPAPVDGPVILFVHGINGVASDWWQAPNDMYAMAYNAGYRTAFVSLSENNTRNNEGIIANSAVVSSAIRSVLGHYRSTHLFIVAHSKGAIDTQAAVLDPATALLVRGVFSLGAPHQGTELADWAFGPGQAQAAPLGLLSPAVNALRTANMKVFRELADQVSFARGVPFFTLSGRSFGTPPHPLTNTTGPVLSALTGGQPNDGVAIVPRTKLPTSYATDFGAVPVNHFALAAGSVSFPLINAQIRANTGNGDFVRIATKGLAVDGRGNPMSGDRQNSFPWSMVWWKGKVYVGTGRAFACMTVATNDVALGQNNYPGTDPDVECTPDPKDLPLAAEIWRFTPETYIWERVYQSPVDVPIEFDSLGVPTRFTARDIAFRGMAVFKENGTGVERLYVGGISASSLFDQLPGYTGPGAKRFPAPRMLFTANGTSWKAVPQKPGTFLGDIGIQTERVNKRGFRSFVTMRDDNGVNRLFVTLSDLRGVGRMLVSSDPSKGNNAWRQASPSADDLPIFTLAVYRNEIYATVGDQNYPGGYAIFKTDARTPDPFAPGRYLFTPVIEGDGMQFLRPRGAISMQEFLGRLYIGTDRPSELIRINPDGSWDLVVGPPRMTASGFKWPLSGVLGKGFNSLFNGHFYSMAVHNGELYLGTWDWSQAMMYSPLDALFKSSYGFDLFKSRDGEHFSVIDRNGFGDPYNASVRNLLSTPMGLFVGITNAQFGLEVRRNVTSLDLDRNGGIDQRDVALVVAATNVVVVPGTFDARDLDGDGLITANDARKMATQCSRPNCALVPTTRVPSVTNLSATTETVGGPRVRLAWSPVVGAARYEIYRADTLSLDAVIPPSTPIPLPDGTTVTFQQIKDGVLTALCQDTTSLGDLCAYLDAFLSGTTLSKSFHWLGSSPTPGFLDVAPPPAGPSLYHVAVQDAFGRISEPSNAVSAPSDAGSPALGALGDRILDLRASVGAAETAALGRRVTQIAEAVAAWRLHEAEAAITGLDQALSAHVSTAARDTARIADARTVVAAVRHIVRLGVEDRLPRAAVTAAIVGTTGVDTTAVAGPQAPQ